jgi:hypothetical protein
MSVDVDSAGCVEIHPGKSSHTSTRGVGEQVLRPKGAALKASDCHLQKTLGLAFRCRRYNTKLSQQRYGDYSA